MVLQVLHTEKPSKIAKKSTFRRCYISVTSVTKPPLIVNFDGNAPCRSAVYPLQYGIFARTVSLNNAV